MSRRDLATGLPHVSKRTINLAYFLEQSARRFPDRPAVVCGARRTTWRELDERVDALCVGLATKGIGKGDRILVQAKNCQELIESMFASFRLGAVWVPVNFRQTPDEIGYLAQSSGARAMIFQAEFVRHAEAAQQASPSLELRICFDSPALGENYAALVSAHIGDRPPRIRVDADDPCWFFYTSGTTGRPKAAVLTHGQMAFVVTNHLCDLMPDTTEEDASLVVAPLSHGAGVHLLPQVARGARSVLPTSDRFDAAEIWQLVATERITNMFTVPTILKMMVDHLESTTSDHSSLRYVIYAGAPIPRKDQRRALDVLGPVIVQYFGLGEVTGNITILPPRLHEPGETALRLNTCGLERTGMQVAIQDEVDGEVPSGTIGQIAVAGPAVFAGYFDNPEANAKAFRDGWFLTGDLGYLDAQGFLYITGRASDMYISGGSNVYPREIEEQIVQHPAISEAAVLGVPDERWGEAGVAVCVPAGPAPDETAFREWLAERVARYKLPKYVVFWEDLPKSGYGKVSKKDIRETLERRGEVPTTSSQ